MCPCVYVYSRFFIFCVKASSHTYACEESNTHTRAYIGHPCNPCCIEYFNTYAHIQIVSFQLNSKPIRRAPSRISMRIQALCADPFNPTHKLYTVLQYKIEYKMRAAHIIFIKISYKKHTVTAKKYTASKCAFGVRSEKEKRAPFVWRE